MTRRVTLRLLSSLPLIVLSGCSSVVSFTSDIEGADVQSVTGVHYGTTPVNVRYDNDTLDTSRNAQGCPQIPGVVYTWPSGATARSTDPIVLCNDSSTYVVTLKRPEGHPDLEKDLRVALDRQLAREKALRQELELERMRNDMFFFGPGFGMHGSIWVPVSPHRPPPHRPPPNRPPRHSPHR